VLTADFSAADRIMRAGVGRVFPAAQLAVFHRGAPAFSAVYGWLDPVAEQRPARSDTRVDPAPDSQLFTVAAFMAPVSTGVVGLERPVCPVLPIMAALRPILLSSRSYDLAGPSRAGLLRLPRDDPKAADAVSAGQARLQLHCAIDVLVTPDGSLQETRHTAAWSEFVCMD
jgi:CubicO group peptidase (beta-lactamase class C family)